MGRTTRIGCTTQRIATKEANRQVNPDPRVIDVASTVETAMTAEQAASARHDKERTALFVQEYRAGQVRRDPFAYDPTRRDPHLAGPRRGL